MKSILLLLLSFVYLHAIITIAPQALGDKVGFSGTLEGSLETKRGNTDKDNYAMGIKFMYDNNSSYLLWLNVTGSYGQSSGTKDTQKSYAHIRGVHSWIKKVDWEAFLQSETNIFTKVEHRRLVGGGLRFHLMNAYYGEIYSGVGAYHEDIAYTTTVDPREKNNRFNFYLAYIKKFQKNKIAYVAYYQPKIDDFNDYITSNAFELEVNIIEHLYINFKLFYDIDSQPARDVKKMDFTQKTSFLYKF